MRMRAALRISQGLSARRPANRPRDIETSLPQETDMRRIVSSTFVSLDGVMQAPGGPAEDPTGGFAFGGWTAPYFDEALGAAMGEIFGRPFDLLLGRKTYDTFAAMFNRITKYVASHSEPKLDWKNSQWLGKDTVAALTKLKSEDGPDLMVQGSSDLLQTLWKAGLVDEFSVLTFPVVLGKGKRLFGEGVPPVALKTVKSRSFPTGVVVTNYTPDGVVRTGDFGLAEPSAAELERRRKLK